LQTAQVDVSKLTGCLTDGSRGLAYAEKDFANDSKYEITGSPTLILDGGKVSEFDFGGRTAEAVKTMFCCAFQEKPELQIQVFLLLIVLQKAMLAVMQAAINSSRYL